MKLRHYLKTHPNTITLRISKIEYAETSFDSMKIYRITLSEPVPEVKGSTKIGDTEMILKNVTEVWIADLTIDAVKAFTVGNYNNMKMKLVNLFLDISRPRVQQNYKGETIITEPAKVWITKERFAILQQILRRRDLESRGEILRRWGKDNDEK